jgi:hypothetical protein
VAANLSGEPAEVDLSGWADAELVLANCAPGPRLFEPWEARVYRRRR